ncbi:MAG: transposase [Candidatus Methanomethylophilaceae archaeon]|nr:transposase [Candidatus Methanomethylophilaceae archaeon]MBP5734654.1 transposase [Candidatus Methanomethylophilaceae archaeon]
MASIISDTEDIKPIIRRGNGGANKGKKYSRASIDNDAGSKIGEMFLIMLKGLSIPEYSCPRSNHVYSVWQKLAILVIMSLRDIPFNSLTDILGMYGGFIRSIGLKHIPCGSTMCKFMSRIDRSVLDKAICSFNLAIRLSPTVIVDTTCLSNFQRSAHYEKRCDDFGRPLPYRTFTKLSLAIDRDTRLAVSAVSSNKYAADISLMGKHLDDMVESEVEPGLIVADKGYDCDGLHREIRNRLGCDAVIPVRKDWGNRGYTTHGVYRNKMLELEKDEERWGSLYNQRVIIESTNFMIKNLTGSSIAERKDDHREKHALLKVLAFNFRRILDLHLEGKLMRCFQ